MPPNPSRRRPPDPSPPGRSPAADPEFVLDLLRGLAAYTQSPFVHALAKTVARYPWPDLANALNRNQMACKLWLRDELHATLGGDLGRIRILGGWYGVLAAVLFDDPRFAIRDIESVDLDPACAPVAERLNRAQAEQGRFRARTADMHALDCADPSDLVINTSCEHIPDLRAWLDRLPEGCRVLLQSNDYVREPEHVNCVDSLEAFVAQARLATLLYAGAFETRNYTRFMLIGRR